MDISRYRLNQATFHDRLQIAPIHEPLKHHPLDSISSHRQFSNNSYSRYRLISSRVLIAAFREKRAKSSPSFSPA